MSSLAVSAIVISNVTGWSPTTTVEACGSPGAPGHAQLSG